MLWSNARLTNGLDIYGINKNVTKSQGYNAMIHRTPSILTVRNKKEHSDRRRLIGEGLNDAAIRGYEPVILSHVDKLCNVVAPVEGEEVMQKGDAKWSLPRNMAEFCKHNHLRACSYHSFADIYHHGKKNITNSNITGNYLAFDIMSDVVFGRKYDLLGTPKYRFLPVAIAGSNIRTTVLLFLPNLTWFRLDKKLFPACIKARNAFLFFMGKLLNERMKASADPVITKRRDVFSALLKVNKDAGKEAMAQEQIGAESVTLVIAGSDTTATAMSSIFFYLAHNRSAYENAAAEVRRTFESKSEIKVGAKLNSCVYLRACIEESMRITPPIGASLFREAGKGGVRVDGHYFPEGMDVGTSIYSIHHNPAYFPRPHRFMPERWIASDNTTGNANNTNDRSARSPSPSPVPSSTTQEAVQLATSAMNPFSIGPRACIGKGLAIVELMLTFATVLYVLDFEVAEGKAGEIGRGKEVGNPLGRRNPEEFQLFHGGITSEKVGPMLRFVRRDIVETSPVGSESEF
jgi:cytochrome P450